MNRQYEIYHHTPVQARYRTVGALKFEVINVYERSEMRQ